VSAVCCLLSAVCCPLSAVCFLLLAVWLLCRARLLAHLVRRRALLDAHCPVLPPLIRALVHGYMELTTTEELWATGLGQAL
jgi:hypothetical protein